MIKYEVQFLAKGTGQWIHYNFTEDYDKAREEAKYLNDIAYNARITRYEIVSEDIKEFYPEKEVKQ